MVSWHEFATEVPAFASEVRSRFEAFRHHVLGTLRVDGSPRLSGTEVHWRGDELELGSMPGALKARDLRRDDRFAVHSNPGDGEPFLDVKLSGHAVEVVDPAEHAAWIEEVGPPSRESHLFRLDLTEAATTKVSEDQTHLVITLWRPNRGLVAFTRE